MEDQRGARKDPGRLGRRGAKAYQWALEGALAVPIAIGLGYWLDTKFDTSPILMLLGAVLGFAALVLRLLRIRTLVEDGAGDEGGDGVP